MKILLNQMKGSNNNWDLMIPSEELTSLCDIVAKQLVYISGKTVGAAMGSWRAQTRL